MILTWTALEGSVRGAAHELTGLPNQDAVATRLLRGGRLVVAAVADGHGGERYVRSDTGSRLAVDIACDVLTQWLSGLGTDDLNDGRAALLGQELREEIVPAIVSEWRDRVVADVADRPFTDEERSRTDASLDSDPLVAYGATLLVTVAADRAIALAQLGDGDILVMRRGEVLLPIEPDPRLVASQTTSLCLDTAIADFRCAVVTDVDGVELVLMSTDGYANSFADDDWEHTVGRDLANRVATLGVPGVERQMPDWLAASAAASGDDTSAVLIVPAQFTDASSTADAARFEGTGLRRLLTFSAVALVLGIAAGWLWGNATANPTASRSRPPATVAKTDGSGVGGPAVSRATLIAGLGVAVAFDADVNKPAPARVASSSAAAITRLRVDTAVWEVMPDGRLTVTVPPAGPVDIATGISVSAIAVAGPAVWAVDAIGSQIVPIDLATHAAGAKFAVASQ